MLASISDLIGTQPILALFLAIGVGYAVGQVNILGFSLGVGAVLFVGLFLGAIAPKAQVAGPIGLVGLIMFLYGIGILYGRQFFEGLSGVGRVYNLLAFVAVVAGLLVALGLGAIFDVKLGHTLGIFAGSMTSTATLQAALDTIGNREPSIGYSVAYPFGVIGPILCFYFLTRRVNPVFPPKPARFHMGEVTIERLPAAGATLGAVMATLPEGVYFALIALNGKLYTVANNTVSEGFIIEIDPDSGTLREIVRGRPATFGSSGAIDISGLTTDGKGLFTSHRGELLYVTLDGKIKSIAGDGTTFEFRKPYDPLRQQKAHAVQLVGSRRTMTAGSNVFLAYRDNAVYYSAAFTTPYVERVACK